MSHARVGGGPRCDPCANRVPRARTGRENPDWTYALKFLDLPLQEARRREGRPVGLDAAVGLEAAQDTDGKPRDLRRRCGRYHFLLHCHVCHGLHAAKLFVVMNNQPTCPHCLEAKRSETAAKSGLQFLHKSDDNRHYGLFRAPCGHDIHRQFELIARAARRECGRSLDLA